MRAALALVAVLSLAACAAGETAVRDQAKGVVNTVVAKKLPGVNAAPVTDCVIDNASMGEVLTIAKGAKLGITDETVKTVMTVFQRPATTQCIANNGLKLFGGA